MAEESYVEVSDELPEDQQQQGVEATNNSKWKLKLYQSLDQEKRCGSPQYQEILSWKGNKTVNRIILHLHVTRRIRGYISTGRKFVLNNKACLIASVNVLLQLHTCDKRFIMCKYVATVYCWKRCLIYCIHLIE